MSAKNKEYTVGCLAILRFLHSHHQWENIDFMEKMTFEILIKSLCLSVCESYVVGTITLDRIIGLN